MSLSFGVVDSRQLFHFPLQSLSVSDIIYFYYQSIPLEGKNLCRLFLTITSVSPVLQHYLLCSRHTRYVL